MWAELRGPARDACGRCPTGLGPDPRPAPGPSPPPGIRQRRGPACGREGKPAGWRHNSSGMSTFKAQIRLKWRPHSQALQGCLLAAPRPPGRHSHLTIVPAAVSAAAAARAPARWHWEEKEGRAGSGECGARRELQAQREAVSAAWGAAGGGRAVTWHAPGRPFRLLAPPASST